MVYYKFPRYIGAYLDVIWCIYGLLNGLGKGKEGKGKIKGKVKGKGKGKGKARERERVYSAISKQCCLKADQIPHSPAKKFVTNIAGVGV